MLFTLLLVSAVVVAAVVVHARTPKLEIQVLSPPRQFKFSPNGNGHRDKARIRFFIRDTEPDATVQIVGPDRQRVRTLYRGPLTADEPVAFTWNGRTAAGQLANPNDRYRLRVILPSQDRDMVYPQQITIVGVGES